MPAPPTNLVGVHVADPGDERLVSQDAFDLPRVQGQPPEKEVERQVGVVRLGPEVGERGHLGHARGQIAFPMSAAS